MVKTNIQTFTGEVEVLEEFYVGSNLVANDVATHVLTVNNTANDAKIKSDFFVGDGGLLSNIATTLQSIADQGNAASNVILFNSNTDVTGYKNVGFVTTSNVGIQNTAPTHTMSIGDKIIIDNNTDESQGESVMLVHGRISADRFQGDGGLLSNIATTLESIADQGNASSNVLIFNSNTDISGYRGVGFVTTSNVGIQNTNPGFNTLSVGSNLFVNIYGSNVLTVHGNAAVSNLLVSEFSVSPAHGLQHVTQEGRATNQTVQLTNTTTGLEVSSNINVAGEVILTNATKGLDVTSNIEIGGRLKFDTNVFVDTLRVADVAANIVTYDRTTGELLDSSGTFMNKFAVVSEQPPSDLFANATTVTNHGGYTLTTSNLATNSNTYNAFDGTANAWVSGDLAGGYIGGANVFLETNLTQLSNLHPTQFGDWLAIEFPYKTTLRHMKLTPLTAAQFPASANIYATNNDLTWTEVNYWSGRDPVTASNVQTITVNATEQFKKYALVATKAAGNSSNVALQDWQLFTESFSIDGGKVAMAQQAATGGETVVDQSGPHGRGVAPLKKYPEIAFESGKFDSNDSTNTYVQAGYTVTVSGFVNSSNHPWKAFNGTDYEVGMLLSGLNYDTNGNANTSGTTASRLSASDSTPYGEWLKLELPNKIKLDKYVFTSRNDATHWTQSVEAGQVWGSNNDSNWVHLHTFTNSGFTGESQSASFNVQTDNYYKYYAFIVTKTFATGSDYYLCIPELEYYGYEEDPPAGDTSVDTTFTSIMNTPQTTGANVYVDGSLGETFTNRVTGPDATGPSATYDETGKYWELNGELTSNIAVEANTFLEGDAPHSVSVWFNSSNLEANVSNTCVFSVSDQEHLNSENLDLQSNTWHNLTYAYQGEGGSRVTYLDGRKVAEDQAEDTFGEYPPFAMTGYSQGGYVVSASSELASAYRAHEAFNGTFADNGDAWLSVQQASGAHNYSGGSGAYVGTANLGSDSGGPPFANADKGEWLKLEMPYKFVLDYITICGSTDLTVNPKNWKIYGSNDDKNWDVLLSKTNTVTVAYNAASGKDHTVGATKAYKYFALVVTATNGFIYYTQVAELEYYGHRENDLVRLPDPTRVLKYPHIAMTGPAQRGYVASASNETLADGNRVWHVFDENDSTFWKCDERYTSAGVENTSSGLTDTSSTAHGGEYVVLESPNKLNITGFNLTRDGTNSDTIGRSPGSIAFLGKNSAPTVTTGWTLIAQQTTSTYTNNVAPLTISGNSNYFKYHAVVIRSIDGNQLRFHIKNIELFGTEENSSIPIQIGGGNIDKVANFRVYDKFIGEDQALEIWDAQKDEFGRAKSSMTLQKGRLGIGTDEPQGRLAVADEPDATTYGLQEFPPKPLVGYKTYMEGHGEFCVSATSIHTTSGGWHPYYAFDKKDSSMSYMTWESGFNDYASAAPHNYGGNFSLGGYFGEYIDFKMPYSIKLNNYSVSMNGSWSYYGPKDFMILASNDNKTWDQIHLVSGQIWASSSKPETINYNVNDTKYYNHFALLVTALAGNARRVNIAEIKFFGYREQVTKQSVLHDGQLTLTKSLTVPRIGPALDADDTPRRDRLVVEYNTSTNPTFEGAVRDTSGRGFDGCLKGGAYYDATEKALKFDGTGDYTEVQLPRHQVKGDWIHSVSCWVKGNVINGEEAVWNIGDRTGNPSGVQASTSTLSFNSASPTLRWYFYSNDGSTNLYTINAGDWNHIVCVYYGGGHTGTNSLVYINGNKVLLNSFTASAALNFDETRDRILMLGRLAWGTNSDLNGSISNFKLYDVALTPEEVKTLYDMGRCDEGHHVVNFSKTRVGIGLGDGEAPGAALDIRGDVSIEGLVQRVGGARGLQIKTNNYVGSIISYDPSEPLNGNFLYQDIITITVYAPSGINYHWQRRMQISRVGSLVSLTGYIVYRANASSQTPYIILPWNQIGCNQRQLPTLVDNFGTGGWSVGGADDGLRLYGPGTVANGVQYNDIKLLVDVGMVGAYA